MTQDNQHNEMPKDCKYCGGHDCPECDAMPKDTVEEAVNKIMHKWFRPAYFEAWTPATRQEQVLHDQAKLNYEDCKAQITQALTTAYNKGVEDARKEAVKLLGEVSQ